MQYTLERASVRHVTTHILLQGCTSMDIDTRNHGSCRAWKYDSSVMEYFVEDECKSLLKRSELLKETETTEKDVGGPTFDTPHLHTCKGRTIPGDVRT